jgi:hypothetical protein
VVKVDGEEEEEEEVVAGATEVCICILAAQQCATGERSEIGQLHAHAQQR